MAKGVLPTIIKCESNSLHMIRGAGAGQQCVQAYNLAVLLEIDKQVFEDSSREHEVLVKALLAVLYWQNTVQCEN